MIYVIGDIYGQLEMFYMVFELIEVDGGFDVYIVFVGDYIDCGFDSKGVIDVLIDGMNVGCNWIILCGNYDCMFCCYLVDGIEYDECILLGKGWFYLVLGGLIMFVFYGVEVEGDNLLVWVQVVVLLEYLVFFEFCFLWFEIEDKLFVYVGILLGKLIFE